MTRYQGKYWPPTCQSSWPWGSHGITPSVRRPWRVVVSEGPPCSKQHPRTQAQTWALHLCHGTSLCGFCLSVFLALLQVCFQGQLPPVHYFNQGLAPVDWLASPPLLPTTIPTATQSPQSPRIRYPLCPLTACPLSSSRALQRPPVLRGFLDASPSPSGSQPPGGTKFLLTWTGCWLNPSALLLRVHADHPTVHAMSRHVMSRHTTPCHARVHR